MTGYDIVSSVGWDRRPHLGASQRIGEIKMSLTIIATATTTNSSAALAAFAEATNHHGALAPAALVEILARPNRADYALASGWPVAVKAANSLAFLDAGGYGPSPQIIKFTQGERCGQGEKIIPYEVLAAAIGAGFTTEGTFDAAVYGGGRSRVAFLAPHVPSDSPSLTYAVIAYVEKEEWDDTPTAEWDYRAAPIWRLAAVG